MRLIAILLIFFAAVSAQAEVTYTCTFDNCTTGLITTEGLSSPCCNLSANGSFWNGTTCRDNSCSIVTSPMLGVKSLQNVHDGGAFSSNACSHVNWTVPGAYVSFTRGSVVWVGFSIYFPADYTAPAASMNNLFQIHGPYLCPYLSGVPLNFEWFDSTGFRVKIQGGSDCNNYQTDRSISTVTFSPAPTKGAWNHFVLRYVAASTATGSVKVWLNGTSVSSTAQVDRSNIRTSWPTDSNYIDFGQYSFDLGLTSAVNSIVYYDNLRASNSQTDAGWAEVDPRQGTADTPDTTAPIVSGFSPTSGLAVGTTSTTISWATSEPATCKWNTTSETYANLDNTADGGGTTSHSDTITGLTDGSSTTIYVSCQDSTPNTSTTAAVGTVSVDSEGGGETNLFTINTDQQVSQELFYSVFGSNYLSSENAYDGCEEVTEACSAGNSGQAMLPWEFDLGAAYDLSSFRIRGDLTGSWESTTVTVEGKVNVGDAWTTLINEGSCAGDQWYSFDLSAYDGYRYIRVEVSSTTGSTQVVEMTLYGTVSEQTQPTPGNVTGVRSPSGLSVRKAAGGVNISP